METKEFDRILFFNQVGGPLFMDLAVSMSALYAEQSTVYSYDSMSDEDFEQSKLTFSRAPAYNTSSRFTRIASWFLYSLGALVQLARSRRGTLVVISSNPPILPIILWPFLALLRREYVVLVYDIYPDVMVALGQLRPGSSAVRIWGLLQRVALQRAECVITIGEYMKARLNRKFDAKRTTAGDVLVLPLWADTVKVKPIEKSVNDFAIAHDQLEVFTVLYSGNIGASHDIETILLVCERLSRREDINFLFVGSGAKSQLVSDFIVANRGHNVKLLPLQSSSVFPLSMACGDISLVSVDKGTEQLMIPSKVSYYMASGAAVIAICEEESDLNEMIRLSGAGLSVRAGDVDALEAAIVQLVDHPDRLEQFRLRSRRASESMFSKQTALGGLIETFMRIGLVGPGS